MTFILTCIVISSDNFGVIVHKYEYIVEFELEEIKYQAPYRLSAFTESNYKNNTFDVLVNEKWPENSIVIRSAGYKNRWFLLFDTLAIIVILFVIEYFHLLKVLSGGVFDDLK